MTIRRGRSKRRRTLWSFVLILLLAVVIVSYRLTERIGPEKQPGDRFTVKRVIDGDTAELLGGDKLRLLSIDTPEKGEKLHDEAMFLLADLAQGKSGRIEFAHNRRDRYGRLHAPILLHVYYNLGYFWIFTS